MINEESGFGLGGFSGVSSGSSTRRGSGYLTTSEYQVDRENGVVQSLFNVDTAIDEFFRDLTELDESRLPGLRYKDVGGSIILRVLQGDLDAYVIAPRNGGEPVHLCEEEVNRLREYAAGAPAPGGERTRKMAQSVLDREGKHYSSGSVTDDKVRTLCGLACHVYDMGLADWAQVMDESGMQVLDGCIRFGSGLLHRPDGLDHAVGRGYQVAYARDEVLVSNPGYQWNKHAWSEYRRYGFDQLVWGPEGVYLYEVVRQKAGTLFYRMSLVGTNRGEAVGVVPLDDVPTFVESNGPPVTAGEQKPLPERAVWEECLDTLSRGACESDWPLAMQYLVTLAAGLLDDVVRRSRIKAVAALRERVAMLALNARETGTCAVQVCVPEPTAEFYLIDSLRRALHERHVELLGGGSSAGAVIDVGALQVARPSPGPWLSQEFGVLYRAAVGGTDGTLQQVRRCLQESSSEGGAVGLGLGALSVEEKVLRCLYSAYAKRARELSLDAAFRQMSCEQDEVFRHTHGITGGVFNSDIWGAPFIGGDLGSHLWARTEFLEKLDRAVFSRHGLSAGEVVPQEWFCAGEHAPSMSLLTVGDDVLVSRRPFGGVGYPCPLVAWQRLASACGSVRGGSHSRRISAGGSFFRGHRRKASSVDVAVRVIADAGCYEVPHEGVVLVLYMYPRELGDVRAICEGIFRGGCEVKYSTVSGSMGLKYQHVLLVNTEVESRLWDTEYLWGRRDFLYVAGSRGTESVTYLGMGKEVPPFQRIIY